MHKRPIHSYNWCNIAPIIRKLKYFLLKFRQLSNGMRNALKIHEEVIMGIKLEVLLQYADSYGAISRGF